MKTGQSTIPVDSKPRVSVWADPDQDAVLMAQARSLASNLSLPVGGEGGLLLTYTSAGLELRQPGDRGNPVLMDFSHLDVHSVMGRSLKQPLAKAIGLRRRSDLPWRVVDATAGWGGDAWLMAGLGCRVWAIERHGAMFALLKDALLRARRFAPEVAERLELMSGDALRLLVNWGMERPDVVYLDPMFPTGRKTAEKKPLRLARQLVGDDTDAPALYEAARLLAKRRVVVKRPAKAPTLTMDSPIAVHRGRGVRYDVYACV